MAVGLGWVTVVASLCLATATATNPLFLRLVVIDLNLVGVTLGCYGLRPGLGVRDRAPLLVMGVSSVVLLALRIFDLITHEL